MTKKEMIDEIEKMGVCKDFSRSHLMKKPKDRLEGFYKNCVKVYNNLLTNNNK